MSKLVLVPAEATDLMMDAGVDAAAAELGPSWAPEGSRPGFVQTRACYRAMLSARPPISAEEVEGLARVLCSGHWFTGTWEDADDEQRDLCRTLAHYVLRHFGATVEK